MRSWNQIITPYWLTRLAGRLRTSENALLLTLATALGLATGLSVWLFRAGIDFFHDLTARLQAGLSPTVGALAIVLALAAAGALVGWIMGRFVGEERHHGVAGIMEAVALAGGRLPYRRMPFKGLASALSLGAGASVGPEDPSVQIGANLGSWFGHRLRVSEEQQRLLVAAGAASAISAAFDAPVAGVFFALEVILNGAFETRSFGIIVLASVMSSALTEAIYPGAEMGPFNYSLGSPLEIPLFLPLGLILALVAVVFVRAIEWQHGLWQRLGGLPGPARTALAGAIVGAVGIFLPQIMGIGREEVSAVLSAEVRYSLLMLLALAAAKVLLTAVSMAGGFVGGVFAPSLFVGTMVGSLYGQVIDRVFHQAELGGAPPAYAIVGMAAAMAGVVRSPITAIMLVFELTNDYRLILPMMLTTVACVYVAERLEPHSIYTRSLARRGVHLPQGRDTDLMQGVTAREAMRAPAPTIPAAASLVELRDALRQQHTKALCVLDGEGLLCGVVTLSDLQRAYAAGQDPAPSVGEICSGDVATVFPEQWVWEAIRIMSTRDIGHVPVVDRGTREVIGLIDRPGLVRAYHVAIARKREDQRVAEQVRLNTLTGGHVSEFVIPGRSTLVGRRIREITWPPDSAVVAIRRQERLIVPHGDTALAAGDAVMVIHDDAVHADLRGLFAAGEQPARQ